MGRNRHKQIQRVKNVLEPAVSPLQGVMPLSQGNSPAKTTEAKHNLSKYISPVQLLRIRHDLRMWREACFEAEFAYYPQRIKMQRMFLDVAQDGHILACVKKRKRLTTLRQFMFKGGTESQNETLKEWFSNQKWFKQFISYCLDAEFYGYSLIHFGDVVDGTFPKLGIVKRWNVSPDRFNVTTYIYAQTGQDFFAPDVVDWHIYVDTPNDDGTSPCGYGLYYSIAIYAITLRNLLGFNSDFVERFGMPYVHVKTDKTNEDERGELEQLAANMGSAGYAVTDTTDEIEFLEAKLAANGFLAYDNLEQRCEKKITKMILGHSDAMDSTPGKLGGDQGDESPVQTALNEVKADDGEKIEMIINSQLLPKMRKIGFPIPETMSFAFSNDKEEKSEKDQQDDSNQKVATIAKTMKDAGMEMDMNYWVERTGIPFKKIEEAKNEDENKGEEIEGVTEAVKNKLRMIYR